MSSVPKKKKALNHLGTAFVMSAAYEAQKRVWVWLGSAPRASERHWPLFSAAVAAFKAALRGMQMALNDCDPAEKAFT